MQQPKRHFSSADAENDNVPEDEIDELFGKLKMVEPPAEVIARILANVSQLSQASSQKTEAKVKEPFEDLDNLVVRNEKKEPS